MSSSVIGRTTFSSASCRPSFRSVDGVRRKAASALLIALFAVAAIVETTGADKTATANAPPVKLDGAAVIGELTDSEMFERDVRAPRPKFIRFGRAGQKFIRFGRSSWNDGGYVPAAVAANDASDAAMLPLRRYFFSSPKRAHKFIRFG